MENNNKPFLCSVLLGVLILLTPFCYAQNDVVTGKKLFNTYCAACHKLDKKVIGPALRGISKKRTNSWLKAWIKDNAKLRASGDSDAIAVFEEYNGSIMTAFPQLSDEDIDNILAYTDTEPKKKQADASTATSNKGKEEGLSLDITLVILSIILLFIIFVIKETRNALLYSKGEEPVQLFDEIRKGLQMLLANKKLMGILTIILVLAVLKGGWDFLLQIGVDKGYQPIQPIAFSHKVHAGENKIDCQYCHSSAKYGKTAGIPSANVCMNCHLYIQEGEHTGTKEIAKIYKAVGYDPEKSQYIKGYKKKPIKWVKIHNLQDFVYFNHSQHVIVGGIKCQECHGPVETMEEVYQYSDLTMGWCVECHRETKVKMKGNPYYEKIHKQLAQKYGKEKLTVDMIGGLECGKCHY